MAGLLCVQLRPPRGRDAVPLVGAWVDLLPIGARRASQAARIEASAPYGGAQTGGDSGASRATTFAYASCRPSRESPPPASACCTDPQRATRESARGPLVRFRSCFRFCSCFCSRIRNGFRFCPRASSRNPTSRQANP